MNKALALISDIDRAIATIETLSQAIDLRDMAKAADVFFVARGMEKEAQRAKALLLKSERKAGEFLLAMDKNPGTRPDTEHGGFMVKPPSLPTLADLGVTKMESHYWQNLAFVPADAFEEYIRRIDEGKEISRSGALALLTASERRDPKTNLDIAGELIRQLIAVMRKMDEKELGYVKGIIADILSRSTVQATG